MLQLARICLDNLLRRVTKQIIQHLFGSVLSVNKQSLLSCFSPDSLMLHCSIIKISGWLQGA